MHRPSQLKAEIRAQALIRRAQVGGAFAMVLYKGDPDAGVIYVKTLRPDGQARLYTPHRTMAGDMIYVEGAMQPDSDISERLRKSRAIDPDFWVIEVEDRDGRHFLTEPVDNVETAP